MPDVTTRLSILYYIMLILKLYFHSYVAIFFLFFFDASSFLRQVEAIALLLINDILKKSPKNPYRHSASYLGNPNTAYLVSNFKRSEDFQYENIIKKDNKQYATVAEELKITTCEQVKSVVTMNEPTAELEDGEIDMAVDQHKVLIGDGEASYVMEGEADMTISQNK